MVRRIRRELGSHIENISPADQILVSRAAWIVLHLARADEKAITIGGMSNEDAAEYASLSRALTDTLSLVGLKAVVKTIRVDDDPGGEGIAA